ncbi:hypothetical protein M9H77_18708 [Catharanthus roseus]|uniref:Uncharacterized protein n=1 Tax=Catharanthus roseus TaxID=4058 RepID=A0ACC0B876_CATRO|nr:hypothetical protein M9H77_18708 [Catharanthus roseus]
MVMKLFVIFLLKHAVIPYLKFSHYTANQAMLEVFKAMTLYMTTNASYHYSIGPPSTDSQTYMREVVTRVRLDPWITNRIDSEFDLKLDPKIFKDTCARADHNQAEFLEQFTEATAMFNLLEASSAQPEKYLVE